ncbi:MAG TPA: metallophosphoesterase family protein, partial [Gaiellaceae bacterium]|nr:metallophosphoesterase family protein [Gaiellaceae bacterium]
GARRLPDACVRELELADLILHAGDVTAASVLRELEAFAPVEAVRGNMDEPALQTALPERRVVEVAGARIGLVHIPGPPAGREERLASWFPGCDAVVYGHTHVPQVEQHRGVWILNPGSPTERRRAERYSLLVVVAEAGAFDIEQVFV